MRKAAGTERPKRLNTRCMRRGGRRGTGGKWPKKRPGCRPDCYPEGAFRGCDRFRSRVPPFTVKREHFPPGAPQLLTSVITFANCIPMGLGSDQVSYSVFLRLRLIPPGTVLLSAAVLPVGLFLSRPLSPVFYSGTSLLLPWLLPSHSSNSFRETVIAFVVFSKSF